jgi:hypothetical protein
MDPLMNWGMDWVWGLPLIVLTVVIHAFGLAVINKSVNSSLATPGRLPRLFVASIVVMGGTALWAAILHGFEGFLWAAAYRVLGALKDNRSAVLYSLGAMTTYGHSNISLAPGWQMMGTLEALDGWILFGLTTAFLFSIMQRAWPQS